MPQRSKLELKGLVDYAYSLFQHEGKTLEEVTAILLNEGYIVSRSGVARAIKKKKLDMKRFDETMQSVQAIVKVTEGRPGTDIGEAALQMSLSLLLDELKQIEDLREMDSEKVLLSVARVSRAIAAISNLKLDYEKGYREGCFKTKAAAADEAERAAKSLGVSDETVFVIRSKILGLSDAAV